MINIILTLRAWYWEVQYYKACMFHGQDVRREYTKGLYHQAIRDARQAGIGFMS